MIACSLFAIKDRLISMDSQYGHRIIELLDSSLFTYLLEIVRGSAVKHLRDEQKD
jgi:hypothetical protein